jgi:hypothetical protein
MLLNNFALLRATLEILNEFDTSQNLNINSQHNLLSRRPLWVTTGCLRSRNTLFLKNHNYGDFWVAKERMFHLVFATIRYFISARPLPII